jgi:hypothetical protein
MNRGDARRGSMMRRLVVGILVVASSLTAACYSRTVVEKQVAVPVPKACERVAWVPATGETAGYWRCT